MRGYLHENSAIIVFPSQYFEETVFYVYGTDQDYDLCPKAKYFKIEDYSGILNKSHRGYHIDSAETPLIYKNSSKSMKKSDEIKNGLRMDQVTLSPS